MSTRLAKESIDFVKKNIVGILAGRVSEIDLFDWTAIIQGAAGSAYEGGAFKLNIKVPENYPHKAPAVVFAVPLYHPNVDQSSGQICLKLLEEWSPTINIEKILVAIRELLAKPEPDHAVNVSIAEEYVKNREEFNRKVKEFIKKNKI